MAFIPGRQCPGADANCVRHTLSFLQRRLSVRRPSTHVRQPLRSSWVAAALRRWRLLSPPLGLLFAHSPPSTRHAPRLCCGSEPNMAQSGLSCALIRAKSCRTSYSRTGHRGAASCLLNTHQQSDIAADRQPLDAAQCAVPAADPQQCMSWLVRLNSLAALLWTWKAVCSTSNPRMQALEEAGARPITSIQWLHLPLYLRQLPFA